jgi:hypothetical protein
MIPPSKPWVTQADQQTVNAVLNTGMALWGLPDFLIWHYRKVACETNENQA